MPNFSGSKLENLTIPTIETGERVFCGPYVLSVLTDSDPALIHTLFYKIRGRKKPIKSTFWSENLFILKAFGIESYPVPLPRGYNRISIGNLFESYNSLSSIIREETCVARVGDHFILIHQGRLTCRITNQFCNYTHPEYYRKMVTHIAVVRQA